MVGYCSGLPNIGAQGVLCLHGLGDVRMVIQSRPSSPGSSPGPSQLTRAL